MHLYDNSPLSTAIVGLLLGHPAAVLDGVQTRFRVIYAPAWDPRPAARARLPRERGNGQSAKQIKSAGVTVTRDEMNCWTCQHAKSESVFYFSSVGLLLLLSLLSLISIHSSRVFRGNYPMHGDLSHHLVNFWWQEQGFPCRTSGFLSQGLRDLIVYIILMTCTRHKRSHPALPDLKDLTQTSLVSDVEVVDLVRKTPRYSMKSFNMLALCVHYKMRNNKGNHPDAQTHFYVRFLTGRGRHTPSIGYFPTEVLNFCNQKRR